MPSLILKRKRRILMNHAAVYVPPVGLGLQTNLASFFSLDNTLADATGNVTDLTNNNSVTFVSSTPTPIAAVTNSAKFVAASSQYLSHADANGINTAGINFSIQLWVYPTNTPRWSPKHRVALVQESTH